MKFKSFWKGLKRYFWNILIAIDQFFNTVFGGDPDETISSRLGKVIARKSKNSWWAKIICKMLDKIDPGHCEKSIEEDEGKNTVIRL